ncbi:MAG: hypothetical protein R2860_06550 [Desulfobacterales bacterium]
MMAYAAETFPGLFEDSPGDQRKPPADQSGHQRRPKAMVRHFNQLGVDFKEDQIIKIRDPEIQKNGWNIPGAIYQRPCLAPYTLTSPDKTAQFSFSHNINGRDIYAWGTFDAILYLQGKIAAGSKGCLP